MKRFSGLLSAVALAAGLALAAAPAMAQQQLPPMPKVKQSTPAAIAAAKEILTMKNVAVMYSGAVPGIIEKTKTGLLQQYLNYQKDLDEVALVVAKQFAGGEKEIGEGMAQIYAAEFTEQELKDLVTFYKTPLGQKLLTAEPTAINGSLQYMQQWAQQFGVIVNGQFKAEMKKRGKDI
ncbi:MULTISPECIES: DUF2059 domain-containing protein [unclassified Bradyrhizobium]|uniref:DUF2059 domain-containing protein n=1 Tax=unclassified Bradyrhizobium TaxID=2631580 RepID=UPI001BA5193E|nr:MULTISPECIES: DUF2059 domain-containing protein [unclassified Bradyrhizobium]MBR1205649.1 DUF2059 domain-containing protein [Bradyrhizobium sp. AUGA SZCCT0124]MBR1313902.1 DUF2059 domain-containing protein [Bradyrhizobium sp. AUGA SZCCT0051]MBR1337976.1 DUF2059 domain-containing protein [Bradyrhizobium sp. AUGA SZCCT0105]MBR1355631.1 DUF2059 domain-containing protein [Bradyrhizobium sp. AUGA SZCCT0045]